MSAKHDARETRVHVLLVDDDDATRLIAKRALGRLEGIVILEADNGDDALRLLRATRVDLVLTDYHMPGGPNGVEVLCGALDLQPHARRVLMSGTLEEARLRAEAEPACVDHLFEKPFARHEWVVALREAFQLPGRGEGLGGGATVAGAEP